jgi:hypothetical protein
MDEIIILKLKQVYHGNATSKKRAHSEYAQQNQFGYHQYLLLTLMTSLIFYYD